MTTRRLVRVDRLELTDAEVAVVEMIVAGMTPSRIADHLGISVASVGSRTASAMDRLGVLDKDELRRVWRERGTR